MKWKILTSALLPEIVMVWISCFLLIPPQGLYSQEANAIDSLMNVLKTQKEDTNKVNVLNTISQKFRLSSINYSKTNAANGLKYGEEALALAKKLNFKRGIAAAYENIGGAQHRYRNYQEAIKTKFALLELRKEIGNKQEIARSHLEISLTYNAMSNFPEALTSIFASLKISLEICDNEKINFCYESLAHLYNRQGNYPESLKYHLATLKTAEGTGNKTRIAFVNMRIGDFFRDLGNLQQALKYYFQAKIIEETGSGATQSNITIGYVYYLQGKYPEALNYYLSALKSEMSQKKISELYPLIAAVFIAQSNFADALKYYQLKLTNDEKIRDSTILYNSYRYIGDLYLQWAAHIKDADSLAYREQLFSEAVKNHHAALRISEESGNRVGMSNSYESIANAYYLQKKFPEAIKNYFDALKIQRETGDQYSIAYNSLNIAKIYIELKKFSEASEFLNDALSLSRESGNIKLIKDSYNHLTTLNIESGNWEAAYYNNKMFTLFRDSLDNKENSEKMMRMQMQYEFEQREDSLEYQQAITGEKLKQQELIAMQQGQSLLLKDREVALLNNEKQLQQLQFEKQQADFTTHKMAQKADADTKQGQLVLLNKEKSIQTLELNKQKSLKNYLFAGIVLLGILSFFVYKNYRTRQKLKLQTLRNKIASDLHDDVGSTLSSISIFSEMAQAQSKEVIPLLKTINESSRKMLEAMADIVWTINPENDQFEKIIMRMRNFAFELLGARDIDFEFNADEEINNLKLPMDVRKNLYLIFKEATNNMVKYSGASEAEFSIKNVEDKVVLTIRDNGKGFDMNQPSEGNGIKSMRKRAAEMGADFILRSLPGKGTSIELKIAV